MKKKRKEEEIEQFYRGVREFCKEVKARGKTGKGIAQEALSIAGIYWLLRYYGSKSEDTKSILSRVDRILRAAGLSITEIR